MQKIKTYPLKPNGIMLTSQGRFLIEPAKDFDDNGRVIDGRGYFVSKDNGKNSFGMGLWFETMDAALSAIGGR